MTAHEARSAFGQLLEAAQRTPVTITRDGMNFGAMFAMRDLETMAQAFLSAPILASLRAGRITISEALLREAEMALAPRERERDQTEIRSKVPDAAPPVSLPATRRRSVI